jgi:hypothetical protein
MSGVAASIRLHVAIRAKERCEYCLIHEDDAAFQHEIDHILSRKHGGITIIENLAYASFVCNRFKGPDLGSLDSLGRLAPLFNPRKQQWSDHFRLDGPVIQPLTSEAEATVRTLRLNQADRVIERSSLQQMGRYPRRIPLKDQ